MKRFYLFLIYFFSAQALAISVDCNSLERKPNKFLCTNGNEEFTVNNVTKPEVLKRAINLVPSKIILPFQDEEVEMKSFLDRLAFHFPYPEHGRWRLPEISLLSLRNNGVTEIQGHSINTIIDEARKIKWEDMRDMFKYFRFQPSRHTGRYNSFSNTVTYGGNDILNHDVADLQQWALHETFGTIGIDDVNYKISTLATLLNDGHIDLKTFNKNQYFDLENDAPFIEETIDMTLDLELFNSEGGITGVEGGGDIVSASIKRYMIIGRQWETGFKVTQKEITEIMNYRIQYTDDFKIMDHPHVYTFFQNDEIYIVLKEKFRSEWINFPHPTKVRLAKEFREFIKEDQEKYLFEKGVVSQ